MNEEAKRLVSAMIAAGESSYQRTFGLDDDRDLRFVVLVLTTDKEGARRIGHLTERYKAVAQPAGQRCPCCNGSGILVD